MSYTRRAWRQCDNGLCGRRSYSHSEKTKILLAFRSFYRNSAIKMAKLLRLGIKKIKIFCSALDFS